LSALLELNTDLPFALSETELRQVEPERYLDVLIRRVKSLTPEVDPDMIENTVIQYQLQVRAQHQYRLLRYDGPVLVCEPSGPHGDLLAAQFRPYVRDLRVCALELGAPSDRTIVLSETFSERIRSHYLSMRDEVFAKRLAEEVEKQWG